MVHDARYGRRTITDLWLAIRCFSSVPWLFRMRADMRKMFMDHHEFQFDEVFDEGAAHFSEQHCPLLRPAEFHLQ